MIYTVKNIGSEGYTVLTEDKGLAYIDSNGTGWLVILHQNRYDNNPDEGKQQLKEFPYGTPLQEMVDFCLNWLNPSVEKWQRTPSYNHKIYS